MNLYGFVSNDPNDAFDYLGLARVLVGFVYTLENRETLAAGGLVERYVGSATVLENRLVFGHPQGDLLFHAGTEIKVSPVFANQPEGRTFTRAEVNNILRDPEQRQLEDFGGIRARGLRNVRNAHTQEKLGASEARFGTSTGAKVTIKVRAVSKSLSAIEPQGGSVLARGRCDLASRPATHRLSLVREALALL